MKSSQKTTVIVIVVMVLIVAALIGYSVYASHKPGQYDAFAKCLTQKGLIFYGAFWCPHCQAEKALLGSSMQYMTYVECSTPDGNAQTQICIDKKIEGYPTFQFADGSRVSGETSLQDLSAKTGCALDGSQFPVSSDIASSTTNTASSSPVQ